MTEKGLFPPTHWSLILAAQASEERRHEALEELLGTYWKPLYIYLRRRGRDPYGAEDALQGFYERLLGRDFLQALDPARGKLRSYLKTALDRHLINTDAHERAQRRGGGVRPLSLSVEDGERELAVSPENPERAFDRAWARQVLASAMQHLERDHAGTPREAAFRVALRFFEPGDPPAYADAAVEGGMTLAQFRSFLHRLRVRYRELIVREVAPTAGPGEEVECEVQELMASLAP